jgi:non-heme chloroperoxidase
MITTDDGVDLYVTDSGSGPVVLFLAGYGATTASWSLQAAALRDTHRVVCVDRRSHGRSARPSYGHRMARHAADLACVLDSLQLHDVVVVGSSMGSNVALAYVDLFGCSRLRGLVLVDQTPKMINEGTWNLGFHGLTRASLETWLAEFPGGLMPFHTVPPAEVLAMTVDGEPFSIDDTRALLRDHTEADWRDVLPRVSVPLLAVAGRHSPTWPCESSAWMADAAPQGSLVVLENSLPFPPLPRCRAGVRRDRRPDGRPRRRHGGLRRAQGLHGRRRRARHDRDVRRRAVPGRVALARGAPSGAAPWPGGVLRVVLAASGRGRQRQRVSVTVPGSQASEARA